MIVLCMDVFHVGNIDEWPILVGLKANHEDELWREIAKCLTPPRRFVFASQDVLIKGSIHHNPYDRKEKIKRRMHKLKETLLRDPNDDSPHSSPSASGLKALEAKALEETKQPAVLYKHRIFYNVESCHSEILASGGLFGLWRPFYREPTKPNDSTEEPIEYFFNEEDDTTEHGTNEDGIGLIRILEAVTSDGVPAICTQKVVELSGRPDRVLQPLCILLESPLPFTVWDTGCHDTLAESVRYEIEPMSRDDNFGQESIDPILVELLLQFRSKLMTLLAVTNFNIEAVSDELRLGSSCFAEAGANISNLAPPFFLACPLAEDGKSLDYRYVIDSLRLTALTSSGVV